VSGSAPVTVSIPLGTVPAAARSLTARFHAASKLGTTQSDDLTAAVPASAIAATTANAAIAPSTNTIKPSTTVSLPGALPELVSRTAFQFSAQYTFRLWCRHTVSCRGTAILTRVGGVRTATFKIPAGQIRSVTFNLTAAQREHVRFRGRRGLRGLLQIESLDEGSSWAAIRLYPHRAATSS
jgi:hypothetical protein